MAKTAGQVDPLFTAWAIATAIGISETAVEFVVHRHLIPPLPCTG